MKRTSNDCKYKHGPQHQKISSQGWWVCRVCMAENSRKWRRKIGISPWGKDTIEPEDIKESEKPELITRVGLANSYRRRLQ